jgi:hypothetical protein
MATEPGREFDQPANYPYLTVASPSCHDVTPLRAWWVRIMTWHSSGGCASWHGIRLVGAHHGMAFGWWVRIMAWHSASWHGIRLGY